MYVALVYLRPTELVAGWQDLPVVLLASLATAPLLASELLRRPRLLVELPHDRFLLGYWAAIIVSDLAWGWREEAVLGAEAFAPIAYLYFLLRASLGTPRRFRGMMLVLTLAVVFHAVSGIVQYHTGIGFGGVAPLMYDGEERIQGPGVFNDPNDLGMAFVVVIPVVLARIQGPAPFVRRVAWAPIAGVLLVALYYTNSRGAILALGAVLAVYAWRRFGRGKGTALAMLALAALLFVSPSRMSQLDSGETSAQGRIRMWSEALQMFKERPLTGFGWSRFSEYHEMVVHNSFMHSLAELGLLGGVCFVGMVYSYVWGLRQVRVRGANHPDVLPGWGDVLMSMGAGLFITLAFLSRQYNVVPYTVLALGACYVTLHKWSGAAVEVRWRDRLAVACWTAGAVVVASVIVRTLEVY